MTRTIHVKNWERFQHYKDRDPPWIKLYRDLLSAESWVLGTDASRLVQVASTLLAARYQNATPLNFALFRKVASLDLTSKQFDEAIQHLQATGFLEIQGDTDAGKHDASKPLATCTSEAEAEAEKRQRRAEKNITAAHAANTQALERVKAIYPKRAGGNPWGKAAKAINARLDEGATVEQLVAGTERYAGYCAATGKVGTEFVKQAATFFGPDCHFREPWNLPPSRAQSKQDANIAASMQWLEGSP